VELAESEVAVGLFGREDVAKHFQFKPGAGAGREPLRQRVEGPASL
jgi:hypothetical protein